MGQIIVVSWCKGCKMQDNNTNGGLNISLVVNMGDIAADDNNLIDRFCDQLQLAPRSYKHLIQRLLKQVFFNSGSSLSL